MSQCEPAMSMAQSLGLLESDGQRRLRWPNAIEVLHFLFFQGKQTNAPSSATKDHWNFLRMYQCTIPFDVTRIQTRMTVRPSKFYPR